MKRVLKIIVLCVGFLYALNSSAQYNDSLRYHLLLNPYVQIEVTEAINSMYDFEFEKSRRHFTYLKRQYPDHPLPHLLLSLNYWWRIVPDYNIEKWDNTFLAYIDTTEVLAKKLYKHNEIEGAFFLAAAYAFEGRLYSERGQYRKAAIAGRNSLKYLGECRGNESYSPELLFGDALFNYYAEWIRENYPLLKPLMMFFPKGDRQVGIEQLKEVARNAFYSRTEAQYYLMRLLSHEENDIRGGLQVAEYLNESFPNNSYFHRFYTQLLYQSGQYIKTEKNAKQILQRIDSSQVGYGDNTGRYAAFFLAHISELRRDLGNAKKYYLMSLDFAEKAGATDKGYYYYSLNYLGRIAEKEEAFDQAKTYYKRVKKLAGRKHSAYKFAKRRLKSIG